MVCCKHACICMTAMFMPHWYGKGYRGVQPTLCVFLYSSIMLLAQCDHLSLQSGAFMVLRSTSVPRNVNSPELFGGRNAAHDPPSTLHAFINSQKESVPYPR